MSEEITVLRNTQLMSSKEIAELTGKRHADVMRDLKKIEPAYVESFGQERKFALSFIIRQLPNGGSKNEPTYNLTKSQSLFLMTGYNAALRAKVQKRWEELETKEQFQIPRTLSKALLLASQQAEQIEQQQLLIEEQTPKAKLHDQLMHSETSISFGQFAKMIEVGRNKLLSACRECNILMSKGKDKNIPYQKYMDSHYFEVIEKTYTNNKGKICISITTLITPKGQSWLTKQIKG